MSGEEQRTHELIGRTIAGKFVLLEHRGQGAMGDVFRARHLALDSTVAIKIMRREYAQDATFFERFQREAKAASRLEHPNSIRVVDFGKDDDGLVYMAMEFLDGRDLFQVIAEETPLSEERVVGILLQVLSALSPAHALGIIHRDLKPENIMVLQNTDDEGATHDFVKVCDFGIAKLSDTRSQTMTGKKAADNKRFPSPSVTGFLGPSLTSSGQLVGTPEYMSPEQARGDSLDTRTDLYSVGVILYQMLTGVVPFMGESAIGIALKHVTDEPEPPSRHRADLSPELERICLKALKKGRDARYQTAREMRGDLRMFSAQAFYALPEGYEFSPRPPRIERSEPISGVPAELFKKETRRYAERKSDPSPLLMPSLQPDPSEPVVLSPSAAPPPDPQDRKSTFVPTTPRGLRMIALVGVAGAAMAALALTRNPLHEPRVPWVGAEQALGSDGRNVAFDQHSIRAEEPVPAPRAIPRWTPPKATPAAIPPAPKATATAPAAHATGDVPPLPPPTTRATATKPEVLERPVPKFDRAAVNVGSVQVQHGSRDAVTTRVKNQLPLLSACYRTALAKKGSRVDATTTMTLSTDERGRIVRATVTGLGELPEAARCMESALVGQIVQPETQAASAKAEVTLVLKAE